MMRSCRADPWPRLPEQSVFQRGDGGLQFRSHIVEIAIADRRRHHPDAAGRLCFLQIAPGGQGHEGDALQQRRQTIVEVINFAFRKDDQGMSAAEDFDELGGRRGDRSFRDRR